MGGSFPSWREALTVNGQKRKKVPKKKAGSHSVKVNFTPIESGKPIHWVEAHSLAGEKKYEQQELG